MLATNLAFPSAEVIVAGADQDQTVEGQNESGISGPSPLFFSLVLLNT